MMWLLKRYPKNLKINEIKKIGSIYELNITFIRKIELGAIFVSNIIIYFLPFMSDVLLDKPENIMVIIGFGGQGLFAARFLIQWITSENAKKSVNSCSVLVFFYHRGFSFANLCNMEKRSCDYCRSICGYFNLCKKFIFYP